MKRALRALIIFMVAVPLLLSEAFFIEDDSFFMRKGDAYQLSGWKLPDPVTHYRWDRDSLGNFYKTAWTRSVLDWNGSQSHITFSYYPESQITPTECNTGVTGDNILTDMYQSSTTLYGRMLTRHSSGQVVCFRGRLNRGNPEIRGTGTSHDNIRRSTAGHELGHALGLAHSSVSPAIMNTSRNRATIFTPQQDDINGVNANYGGELASESNGNTIEEIITYDIAVASSLDMMVSSADVIVVGTYGDLIDVWNMNRNPEDVSKPDEDHYVEGHLYNFVIEDTIKGNVEEETITINHRVNEKVMVKDSSNNDVTGYELKDPYYVKPDAGGKYILFLNYTSEFDNYYAAIEPFQIQVLNDSSVNLVSAPLVNPGTNEKQQYEVGGETIAVSLKYPEPSDFISGKGLNEIKNQIYQH